ncbi:MAG: hypothetical protein IJE79_00090 [Alphaproteobacteria bacterium]|nr:hypothetical protein [Alphaproteobacteria bacterium]
MNLGKIISFAIINTLFVATPYKSIFAGGINASANEACYYADNHYYFCGEAHKGDRCGGSKKGYVYRPCCDHRHDYGHGAKETMDDGNTYFCCNKNGSKKWVQSSDKSFTTRTDITTELKTNSDGTSSLCTTTKKFTVCSANTGDGSTPDSEVTECHDCSADKPMYRNGECIAFCGQTDYTMAFSAVTSNECIECKTTKTSGIAQIDAYGCNWGEGKMWDATESKCVDKTETDTPTFPAFNVCVKCNAETQFFDATKGICVNKNALPQKNKMELKQCWLALSTMAYKCCLELGYEEFEKYNNKTIAEQQTDKGRFNCCVNGGYWNGGGCQLGETELPLN